MTDDRRRAADSAPPSAEPEPDDRLPFAETIAHPRAQGSRLDEPAAGASAMRAGSRLPHEPAVGTATIRIGSRMSHDPAPGSSMTPAGSRLSHEPALSSTMPLGSRPPEWQPPGAEPSQPEPSLPYAPTITPQLGGPTLDIRPLSSRGSSGRGAADAGAADAGAGSRALEPLSLDPGQRIGRFVIRKRLGEGGMGIVLAAHDADLDRAVAIKLVKTEAERPAYRARLLREAQAMARLEHPNVLRVYEVGSDRGRVFVAMELVDGITLTAWLAGPRRPWREVVAMFAQIGAGLAAAHRTGLVHRDFKPDNVLVDREGRARVADFGLARLDPDRAPSGAASPALAAALTRSGMVMGTPGYMAPEQQAGSTVDARADQYSYCVALREALLGGRVVRLDRSTWRHVPRALRAIVERGLQLEPGERFASMDALLDALRRLERRSGTAVSVAVAVVAIAAGIATTALVMSRDRGAARTPDPTVSGAPGGAPAPQPRLPSPSSPTSPGTGSSGSGPDLRSSGR